MFNQNILLLFLSLTYLSSAAQTVTVKKENARIKSDYVDGFQVDLDGTYEDVDEALTKLIKVFGKSKEVENHKIVAEPTIKGVTYTQPLFAMTKQVGNVISAWIGIQKKEWRENDAEQVTKELESTIHSFGVNFYRDKIQKQIDESVRAQQAVEKQQQRLVNQNKDLNNKVENNKKEKIKLEQAIIDNKVEMENLLARLEKNKKDQDSIVVAAEQIKKVVEMHRERQKAVH